MQRIEKTIEVNVPVRTAYNQWTQFEQFPQFMEGVLRIEQRGDKALHWVAEVAGRRKEWDAEIVEQVPDDVVSWRSTSGTLNAGSVSFTPLGLDKCRITLIMSYEPEGGLEAVGSALGVLSARVEGDLRRFKKYIEERQVETGGWRGEIHEGQVEKRDDGMGLA
ncbi:MAG: hypothetical protein QOD77_2171 [Thermoplasmata archaeon]|jgi:uncharacterized membrane protein|nr:hypothetical protein [Thermoplasmata archaeon]